jgi:hypothetical protein
VKRVDRDLVEQLLQDPSLSYREVARLAGCSDYSVRSIARKINRSDQAMTEPPAARSMRRATESEDKQPEGVSLLLVGGCVVLFFVIAFIARAHFGSIDLPPDYLLGDEQMR